jgi:hypothetical protein
MFLIHQDGAVLTGFPLTMVGAPMPTQILRAYADLYGFDYSTLSWSVINTITFEDLEIP